MPNTSTSTLRPFVMLCAGAIAVSFAAIFATIAMKDGGVGAFASAFWRMLIAAPFFIIVVARRAATGAAPAPTNWRDLLRLAIPGAIFAGDLAVWHLSFQHTSVASATLLANLQIIGVGIVGWLAFGERHRRVFILGAIVAFVGVALMVTANAESAEPGAKTWLGDALAIATAAFYASYLISIKWLRRGYDTFAILAVSCVSGSLVLLPLSLFSSAPMLSATPAGWWALIGLALVPHCLGQSLIVTAMARLPVSFVGVTLLMQPVATTILGWVILGQTLGAGQIGAGLVVLVGIDLARRGAVR